MELQELKIQLNKYGFYSLNKEPFLYAGLLGNGFTYTYKHPYYGDLTRVYIPNDINECASFLQNYYDYKKKENKVVTFGNYKVVNPIPSFKDKENTTAIKTKKEQSYLIRIKRTALILVQLITEKINIQNTTYLNLEKMNKEYFKKKEELAELIAKILKNDYHKTEKTTNEEVLNNYDKDIEEMESFITNTTSKEQIESYITVLIAFLKSMESDESGIKNKYELIKLPLEIELINKSINTINEYKSKKKYPLKTMSDINNILDKLKDESSISSIVSFKDYKDNEQKRIAEKYMLIPDIDIRTQGDYLCEFDNIKIAEPGLLLKNDDNAKYTYEQIMNILETEYKNLSKEDQNTLIIYHSILKYVYDIINLKKSPITDSVINELIDLLNNPSNILMKVKYFKNINTTKVSDCKASINDEFSKLDSIKPSIILDDINVFFKGTIPKEGVICASNKRFQAPLNGINESETTYIVTLKKDAKIYFVPTEITYDINSYDNLVLQQNKPFFLIPLKYNRVKYQNNDTIKVTKYELVTKNENNLTIVTDLKSTAISKYQEIVVECEENYE